MICFVVVTLVCCTPAILAEHLPYPLQLFYLTPSNVGIIPPYQVASSYRAIEKTMAGENPSEGHIKPTSGDEEVIEGETSQFHSQDHRGRALFGYTTPDQARIESRSEDGTVRGSYSYVDAWGNAVKVRYWDDGTGFHAAGNNLPGLYTELPKPVQDTPEVMAAKEQHFQLFQQALAAAVASTDIASISNAKPQQTHLQQEHEDKGVVVDSEDVSSVADDDLSDLTRYPNLQMFPQHLFDPTHVHDANREAVIVDNPDISSDVFENNLRAAKTLQVKPGVLPAAISDGVEQHRGPGGFFYSFRYPVPLYVQVRTKEAEKNGDEKNKGAANAKDGLSMSQKAALFSAIPVAAVHDAQVPPHLKDSIKNYQVMPLYIETSGARK